MCGRGGGGEGGFASANFLCTLQARISAVVWTVLAANYGPAIPNGARGPRESSQQARCTALS